MRKFYPTYGISDASGSMCGGYSSNPIGFAATTETTGCKEFNTMDDESDKYDCRRIKDGKYVSDC